jgi:uncharacterized protein (DUF885 family)
MLENFFEEYLTLNPSFGSFLGDHKYDHAYENILSSAYTKRIDALYRRYNRYKSQNKVLEWIIHDHDQGKQFQNLQAPLSSFRNNIVEFTFMNKTMYVMKTKKDVQNALMRHKCFCAFVKDCIKEFIHPKHILLPRLICEKLIKSLEDYLENKEYIIPYHEPDDTEYEAFLTFLNDTYAPLIVTLVNTIKTQYLPKCSKDKVGLCAAGDEGKAYYEYLLKSMTTLNDITPEEVYKYGKREVTRITKLLHETKVKLGVAHETPLQTFYKAMLENPQMHVGSKKQLLQIYNGVKKDINKNVMLANFHTQVESYDIKLVPKSMEKSSAGAFYYPGNGTRKGPFYINARDLNECHMYNVMTLSLHEGCPGHHYQFQYFIEKNLPLWKRYLVSSTALIEGWALYAEGLLDYTDRPLEYFGRLTYDMFRAVRLVVDTGIHWKGWTYEQAVSYMTENLAMARSEIETEVQRYICMPAQAVCYKIGERELWKLRKIHSGNIKDFHELIMEDGVLPFDLLKDKIVKEAHRGEKHSAP